MWLNILFISQESWAFTRGVRRADGRGRGEVKQCLLRFVLVWIGLRSWRSSATHLRSWQQWQQCSGRHCIVCGLSFLVSLLTRWSPSQLACFYSLPFCVSVNPPGDVFLCIVVLLWPSRAHRLPQFPLEGHFLFVFHLSLVYYSILLLLIFLVLFWFFYIDWLNI